MALVGMKDNSALLSASSDQSPAVRMGVLLALRRQKSPEIARFLADAQPDLVLEAARAINDEPIAEALPALAKLIATAGLSEPVLTRAVNANFRMGTNESAAALAKFAASGTGSTVLRAEALKMLGDWDKSLGRDIVTGLYRPLPPRNTAAAKAGLAPLLNEILKSAPSSVRVAALSAGTALEINTTPLESIVADASAPPTLRAAALGVMADRKDKKLPGSVNLALADPAEPVRVAAIGLAPRVPGGFAALAKFIESGSAREQQAALQAIGSVGTKGTSKEGVKEGDALLMEAFDRAATGKLTPEARLDLLTAAATRKSGKVADRLKAYNAATRKKGDDLAAYRETLAGGDAEHGESIFRERQDVSCLRCHAIRGVGGNAGPDMAGLSKRGGTREYILESILYPSKKIAPGYETVSIWTTDGDAFSGLLKSEDDKEVRLDVPNQGIVKIEKATIRTRKGGQSGMPDDISKSLSKEDIRDLVEFLSGL